MARTLIVLLAVTFLLSVLPEEVAALTPAELQIQATWAIVLAAVGLGIFALMLIVLAVMACRRRGRSRGWCRRWCDDDDRDSELLTDRSRGATNKAKNNNANDTSSNKMLVAVDS